MLKFGDLSAYNAFYFDSLLLIKCESKTEMGVTYNATDLDGNGWLFENDELVRGYDG